MKKPFLYLSFVAAFCAATSVSAERLVQHAMGVTQVPDAPDKVVTLTNETTEAALAVGITPIGAAASWYGDPWYPHLGTRLSETAELGTELAVNLEALAILQPDLIIGSRKRDEEIYEQLSAIAPTVLIAGIGDWRGNLSFVAETLGRETAGAEALAGFDNTVARLQQALGEQTQEVVSVVRFVPGQTYLYQADSFLGRILSDVGFSRPARQGEKGLAIAVGSESIPDMDGHKLVWLAYDTGDGKGDATAESMLEHPLWSRLDAVRTNSVYKVNDGVWATAGGEIATKTMPDDLARIYRNEMCLGEETY